MKKAIELLKRAKEIIGDGFHREGGTDQTGWDDCAECGMHDFSGHKEGCEIGILVKDLEKFFEENK